MHFIISTQELNYLINKCQNVAGQKATIPILSNILFEAKNGELIVTATDLTVGIRCTTEVKILEEGSTTLPSKKLASLVRELTAANVEVTTNSNHVTEIVADSSRFRLHGMSRSEYPELPDMNEATPFTMPQEKFKEMLFRTAFAVSRDDNRYALTGVNMLIANAKATFVGTDGKRLARTHTSIPIDPAFSGNYIIPLKAVEEILKNLSTEGDVRIFLMTDKIGIEANDTLLITKLLSGEYPDIDRVIPEKVESKVSLHREELATLLRQVSLFTPEATNSVKFSFTNGELRLQANNAEVGEGKVSMPVNYQGEKLDIAFNPHYFLDILRHTQGDAVTMGLTDSFNPSVLTDQELNAPTHATTPVFVLMPMRLQES